MKQCWKVKFQSTKVHVIKLHLFLQIFLADLNDAYDQCNWKVKILTQTAVSDHDGMTNFYSDHDKGNLEWGGTVFGNKLSINL